MDNRYFIGNLPNSEMSQVYKVIVGLIETQVKIDKGKKIVVKLPKGDDTHHGCLNSFKEIS